MTTVAEFDRMESADKYAAMLDTMAALHYATFGEEANEVRGPRRAIDLLRINLRGSSRFIYTDFGAIELLRLRRSNRVVSTDSGYSEFHSTHGVLVFLVDEDATCVTVSRTKAA